MSINKQSINITSKVNSYRFSKQLKVGDSKQSGSARLSYPSMICRSLITLLLSSLSQLDSFFLAMKKGSIILMLID